jgi:hypothetical protein
MAATPRTSRAGRACAAVLLAVHAGLLAWAATRHSPCTDEVGHLPAGLSHWYFGRFDLYRVNPPLVRMLAAVPVACAGPATDWRSFHNGLRPEWEVGLDFVEANGPRVFAYFTWARWACIPLSLLGGCVCWRWAGQLYGPAAGLLALTLWCFCPNVLAHAQLITPDAGAAALGVTAAYLFWRWLGAPTLGRAVAAGVGLGLAELAKTTWLLLFILWPILWCLYGRPRRRQGGQLATLLLCGLGMLHLGYGCEDSFVALEDFHFVSQALGSDGSGNRFAGTWLGRLPVPVPKNYLLGIDLQKREFEADTPAYLAGRWQRGGWWYYYLYALAVKVPLGTWLLVLGTATARLLGRGGAVPWRDETVVLVPAAAALVLVSSQTGLNQHLRYVLPAFPFVFVWVSQAARIATSAGRLVTGMAAAALLWSVGSSLAVYPHSLSYFNEWAGGPQGGHAHLLGSNLDWGQDLFYLRRWVEDHPDARPLGLACAGLLSPRHVGLDFPPPPPDPAAQTLRIGGAAGPQPGWYAVSVNVLRERGGAYAYFLRLRPVAQAGYSIYIYHLTPQDAEALRRRLERTPPAGAAGEGRT